jgi:hypothetical protein
MSFDFRRGLWKNHCGFNLDERTADPWGPEKGDMGSLQTEPSFRVNLEGTQPHHIFVLSVVVPSLSYYPNWGDFEVFYDRLPFVVKPIFNKPSQVITIILWMVHV